MCFRVAETSINIAASYLRYAAAKREVNYGRRLDAPYQTRAVGYGETLARLASQQGGRVAYTRRHGSTSWRTDGRGGNLAGQGGQPRRDEGQRGKTVQIALAWQNERGIIGQWSEYKSAIIP
jgi:hypothetical protein